MTKGDAAIVLGVSAVLAIVGAAETLLGGAFIFLPIFCTAAVLIVVLEVYRRLWDAYRRQDERRVQDYRQIEALFSLFSTLQPRLPLPSMREWAASPDLLKKITELVLDTKPSLVVEASSGVSTLVIAYCLKRLGCGSVVSLEHDAKYAAVSRNLLSSHGLEDVATIVLAPLKECECDGSRWLWYDLHRLRLDRPIDLLIVDGPPNDVQKLSRYPALPLLYPHLSATATILLDDGAREDEREIVARWRKRFSRFAVEVLEMEKGAYLLRRQEAASTEHGAATLAVTRSPAVETEPASSSGKLEGLT
jgi:predicted O-methyltransferase YrrM